MFREVDCKVERIGRLPQAVTGPPTMGAGKLTLTGTQQSFSYVLEDGRLIPEEAPPLLSVLQSKTTQSATAQAANMKTRVRLKSCDLHKVQWSDRQYSGAEVNAGPFKLTKGKLVTNYDEGGIEGSSVTLGDVQYGDLDGDGKDEALVELFAGQHGSLAGNSRSQVRYSVFRLTKGCVMEYVTSSEWESGLSFALKLNNGALHHEGLAWGPNDASCCPTGKRVVELRLQGDKLAKVKDEQTFPDVANHH